MASSDLWFAQQLIDDYSVLWGHEPNSRKRSEFIRKYACILSLRNKYNVLRAIDDPSIVRESYRNVALLSVKNGDLPAIALNDVSDAKMRELLEVGVTSCVRSIHDIVSEMKADAAAAAAASAEASL